MILDERTRAEHRRDAYNNGLCWCGTAPMSLFRTDPDSGYVFDIVCPACSTLPPGAELLHTRPLGLA